MYIYARLVYIQSHYQVFKEQLLYNKIQYEKPYKMISQS